jgi:hypothetical protein
MKKEENTVELGDSTITILATRLDAFVGVITWSV